MQLISWCMAGHAERGEEQCSFPQESELEPDFIKSQPVLHTSAQPELRRSEIQRATLAQCPSQATEPLGTCFF